MQKVYEVEIDVDLLREAERRRGRVRGGALQAPAAADVPGRGGGDLPDRTDELGCVNPEFSELPVGRPTFRVFAQVR